MSTKPSTPSPRRLAAAAGAVGLVACLALASPAIAQLTVFDPANHAENALQAARQLQSLANEAQMLTAQARQLAASPYSHLAQSSQTIAEISALAGAVNGLSADISKLQGQFEDLYPTSVKGLDPKTALAQSRARAGMARATAEDLASTAAELERLAKGRDLRMSGALSSSQAAVGQTAAIQSSVQMLSVLAEDMAAMRTVLLAQSRLMAEESARRSSDRALAQERRRQFYGREPKTIPPPDFAPFPHAKE
jgi:type IV secretion system protein TrbJ